MVAGKIGRGKIVAGKIVAGKNGRGGKIGPKGNRTLRRRTFRRSENSPYTSPEKPLCKTSGG